MSHEQSNDIGELAKALAGAQAELEGAKKTSVNPHFRTKYADLSACWEAIRETLPAHGLSVVQTLGFSDGRTIVTTQLMHASGQWIRGSCPIRPVKDDPQGMGSAITYGRRYGLAAIVGLTQDDDDGNASSNGRDRRQERSAPSGERNQRPARTDIRRPTPPTTHKASEARFNESGELEAIKEVEPKRREPKFKLNGEPKPEARRVKTLDDAIELVPNISASTPLEPDDFASKPEWKGLPLEDCYGWQDAAIETAKAQGFKNLNDADRAMALWAKELKGRRKKGAAA